MNTSGWSPTFPTWFQTSLSVNSGAYAWAGGSFGGTALGAGYCAGTTATGGSQFEYHNVFGVNQWQAWTSCINATNPNLTNYFNPLLHQPWIVGWSNNGCHTAGTDTTCYDPLAYYPGLEPVNNGSRSTACAGKNEYCGTPFFHITKVTPQASAGDQVVLVGASLYTIMQGDLVEVRYLNGHIQAFCKQGSSPTAFVNNHAYTVGQWIMDSNGNVQDVTTAGTSQTSGTPTWGSTWTGYAGATTTSGTAVFTYFGALCPTTSKYTRMINVADSDLQNPAYVPGGYSSALGIGFPTIWAQSASGALPIWTAWSAGTVGYGTGEPCQTPGQCPIPGGVITPGVF